MESIYKDATLFQIGLYTALQNNSHWNVVVKPGKFEQFQLRLRDQEITEFIAPSFDLSQWTPRSIMADPWQRPVSLWPQIEKARLVRQWINCTGTTEEACGGVFMKHPLIENEVFVEISEGNHGLKLAYVELAMILLGAMKLEASRRTSHLRQV